ncbi:MAG: CoA-substrate-specific enzyme activase, partial [Anaerospora sp.]|nr:CoA-substrate-specific enzyme activase [Anaerospora sp.]
MFRIGLDIGCSALKYAIVDKSGAIIASGLKIHRGSLDDALLAALDEMEDTVQSGTFLLGITGELAERYPAFSAFHINEASAITKAVQKTYPAARSIMEIGAQQAKYISGFASQTTSSFTFAMNGSCASGTGAFIEEQLQRLSISFEQFDQMAGKAKSIPGIAGRCSVFSKTDMIHQQQSGVPLEDILLGLVYALVRNYKSNVVQKHPVQKPVLLAGGVTGSAHVVKALQALFDLQDEDIIRPVHLRHITAIGAALSASEEKLPANLA